MTNKKFRVVRNIIKEIRDKFPEIKDSDLYDDGKIYYMNGNDSTPFDWACNDRVCEFFVFHKNEMGFIKLLVNKDNTYNVYVYEDGGISPTAEYNGKYIGSALGLKRQLVALADNMHKWDECIDNL